MGKIFHYEIEVSENGSIVLSNESHREDTVYNEETEKWEQSWDNENEVKDIDNIDFLNDIFEGETLEHLLRAKNLLYEIFGEISTGDGEMSYEMFAKVNDFFGRNIDAE